MLRTLLIVPHVLIGPAAVGSGQELVGHPRENALALDPASLKGSPFPDFLVPGLFLGVAIAGTNLVSAAALLLGRPWVSLASLGAGLLLVAWVVIQAAIIGWTHWSQAIWLVLFPTVAALAGRLVARERSWRTN